MRAAVVVVPLVLGGACPAAPQDGGRGDDRRDDGENDDSGNGRVDDDSYGNEPCPTPGAGLALEETAAFAPADDRGDGVVVVMGGGVEVDRAAARFVDGAEGGDVLVLRASGSTSSYTGYFAGSSGELTGAITRPAHAVATLRIDDAEAGADDAVLCRVRRADAVWLAGGDQSAYLLAWPASLRQALADAVARGAAVGGTSAGAMSWSAFAFTARDGGVTSTTALATPRDPVVNVGRSPFAALPAALVDTHFQARDREGRLLVFLAHVASGGLAGDDGDPGVIGVGLDEQTALVVDVAAGTAAVADDDGGAVWLYAVDDVTLDDGPLDIGRVQRLALNDGDRTGWPPALRDAGGGALPGVDVLRVVDGGVQVVVDGAR
jgi:cyanophycinase-like exopeptidase